MPSAPSPLQPVLIETPPSFGAAALAQNDWKVRLLSIAAATVVVAFAAVAFMWGGLTRSFRGFSGPFVGAGMGCLIAVVVLFLSGAGWLMLTAHLSLHTAWTLSIAPFLPGELVKIVVAAGVYRTLSQHRHN